ncbi:MAG TPA: hypothetical protein VKR06_11300 [Ktedonosporobacter sp.]|nr:hypothetical protein [Ktedonosporobacter sp.]
MNTGKQTGLSRVALLRELPPSTEAQAVWYHQMQEHQPVRYRPEYDLWEVFRYQDVQRVLRDHAAFSVESSLPADFPSALGKSEPPIITTCVVCSPRLSPLAGLKHWPLAFTLWSMDS